MSLLKQLLLSVIVLLVGVGGWYVYQNPQLISLARETPEGAPERGGPGAARQGARGSEGRAGRIPGLRNGGAINVITATVATDRTDEALTALGTAKAVRSVTVFPEESGIVAEVAFTPGSRVEENTLLFRLEDGEQRVAVERARLALEQARAALDRARQLAQSNAVSAVALSDAEMAAQLAETELKSAEIAASRREIRAPFAGVTGLTDVSVGDLVSPSAGIVSLDDLSTILVGFEVPERWARRISSGLPIEAAAQALPGSIHRGEVTAIDSRVDETSRTLRMEAALGNERGDLKPGMSIAVGITFPGEERLGVPSLAVQWDREGSFVWKLDGDVVRRTEVAILSRRSDGVIVQGGLSAGDEVVVEGVQRLRDGAKVARVGDASPAPQAKPETAPMAEAQPESAPAAEAQARTATAEPQPEAAAAPQAEAQTATPPEPQAAAVPETEPQAGPETPPATKEAAAPSVRAGGATPPIPEPKPDIGANDGAAPIAEGREPPPRDRS